MRDGDDESDAELDWLRGEDGELVGDGDSLTVRRHEGDDEGYELAEIHKC